MKKLLLLALVLTLSFALTACGEKEEEMKVLTIGDIHWDDWWKSVIFGAELLYSSFSSRTVNRRSLY